MAPEPRARTARATATAWLRAARLPSQAYIALPLLLGQAWAAERHGVFDVAVLVVVQLFGLFDQLYIVFANDVADVETDRRNATFTPFSGGSRVLVDGALTPGALARAAALMAALALASGVALGVSHGRWAVLPLQALGLALLWAYSFPPLALSYRGGGELLQAAGVGVVLPLVGHVAQAGTLAAFPWVAMAYVVPLQLASAMTTALPDEPSDRTSDKRTSAVLLGGAGARLAVLLVLAVSLALWLVIEPSAVGWPAALPLAALVLAAAVAPWARPGTRAMQAFAFAAIATNLSTLACAIALALRATP